MPPRHEAIHSAITCSFPLAHTVVSGEYKALVKDRLISHRPLSNLTEERFFGKE